jgi:hypothetical protein
MDRGLRASSVESRPVCFADIRLGVVVDLLLDDSLQRVLGFDVLCGDRVHRYLPLAACEFGETHVSIPSALVLMQQELDFYRLRGRSLTTLRGFPARRGARELGTVLDLIFTPEGGLGELLVEADGRTVSVAMDADVVVGPDALRPAV